MKRRNPTKSYKLDLADMEQQLIQQGEDSYKPPRVNNPPFEILIRNPLYGQGVYIPMPTTEAEINKAISAVTNDGQFDWEVADVELHAYPDLDMDVLEQIGLSNLDDLNNFAKLYQESEPIQIEWAASYAEYSGESVVAAFSLLSDARQDLFGWYSKAGDARAFPDIQAAVDWYLARIPIDRYMAYLDYDLVDPLLLRKYGISAADLKNEATALEATQRFIRDMGKRKLLDNPDQYFDMDKVRGDLNTGDWFISREGKHGFYIFDAENNAKSLSISKTTKAISHIGDLRPVDELGDEYVLIDRDYDIQDIIENNTKADPDDFGYLFVLMGNAEYDEIWGGEGSVPYLNATVERLA